MLDTGNIGYLPSVYRLDVRANTFVEIFSSESPFGVAFGGQQDGIQRIVFGTDMNNQIDLAIRIPGAQ